MQVWQLNLTTKIQNITNLKSLKLWSIERWRQQREPVKRLKENLTTLKKTGKQKLSSAPLYRPEVAVLARVVPARILARELRIAYFVLGGQPRKKPRLYDFYVGPGEGGIINTTAWVLMEQP